MATGSEDRLSNFRQEKVDPGESFEDAAKRELREEIGYLVSKWLFLRMAPCVGYPEEILEFYACQAISAQGKPFR